MSSMAVVTHHLDYVYALKGFAMAFKIKPIPNTTKLSELEVRQNYV